MMDFHILIVITCVFLASLCSLLLINRFFKRKTFEEILAEKKALTDKIYGQTKSTVKKPKKVQQIKKEQKREKKQRQKEQRDNNEKEQEDSDAHSDIASVKDEPPLHGLSKIHVEFEPDPEILTYTTDTNSNNNDNNNTTNGTTENISKRHNSNAEKDNLINLSNKQLKPKKDKKMAKSILVNKDEPIAVKTNTVVVGVEEKLNNFEERQPKDELKKHEKEIKSKEAKEVKEEKVVGTQSSEKLTKGKDKGNKKDKIIEQTVEVVNIAKELKQLDEKLVRHGSPKNQTQNNTTNKFNMKAKKQTKENVATNKEIAVNLNKLSDTDIIGVSLLMDLFRRAELNRSEIQILIDYLLNKQQDTPNTHAEWSDDICQKLKRQLMEKERLLAEEQEASMGIQAKLRDLRTEINTERAQMNANVKAYLEKIQSKEQELLAVNQELQTQNEKFALERQQFQAKLLREKQAGSQDMLAQLQLMQNELAHKDKCITELTCMMNASHQAAEDSQQKTSELIQTQVQQIRALEQQRDELEQISNTRVFEIEKAKTLECENAEKNVEIRNLENALESTKADLMQAQKELESMRVELARVRNVELIEKQNEIQLLQAKNAELQQQIAELNSKSELQCSEQCDLQATLNTLKTLAEEKEQQLQEYNLKDAEMMRELTEAQNESKQRNQQIQELEQSIESLKSKLTEKEKKLSDVKQHIEKFSLKETELMQQLQEQKEKNNQHQQMLATAQKSVTTASTTTATDAPKDQEQIRELFRRLYPNAVNACAGSALTLTFDDWVEQVVSTHIKQLPASSNNDTSSNHKQQHNDVPHNENNTADLISRESSMEEQNVGRGRETDDGSEETQKLRSENAELRIKIDELTTTVTKSGNKLAELENRTREQDENWRIILSAKDDQIHMLQHSNGQEDI